MESGNGGASSKGDEPFPPPTPLIRLSLQDLKKKSRVVGDFSPALLDTC